MVDRPGSALDETQAQTTNAWDLGQMGNFFRTPIKRLANCQIRFTLGVSALRRAQGVAPSRPIPTPVGPPSAPHRALPHPGVSADTFLFDLSSCVRPVKGAQR